MRSSGCNKLCCWLLAVQLGNGLGVATNNVRGSRSRLQPRPRAFEVYWNVPSFMCRKYGLEVGQLGERWGIAQNEADQFHGDKVGILYDPGAFPALLRQDEAGAEAEALLVRNGGVPQEGDLARHLRSFRQQLDELLPSGNFSGLGVIDMESWRPVFRQNWASLQLYRNYSLEVERRRQPGHSSGPRLEERAARRFEKAARRFMEASLRLAKQLRPRARWGYYAYPYCFNWSPGQPSSQCAPQVKQENDHMSWLFGAVDLLLPSVYLQRRLSAEQRLGMVRGRVQEAVRLATASTADGSPAKRVLAYYWLKYQDQRDTYLDKRDLSSTLGEIAKRGADGLVIWGSSSDLDSRPKCQGLLDYLEGSLGPALQRLRLQRFA